MIKNSSRQNQTQVPGLSYQCSTTELNNWSPGYNSLYVSGSSKIQILMIFIEHVPIKVGVANINWVIYILVSNIPAHF